MAGRFKIKAIFEGIDRITAPLSRIGNQVGKVTRGISGGLNRVNRSIDGALGGMRRWGFRTVIVLGAVTAAMTNVMATGARFEQQMVIAAGKMGKGIEQGTLVFKELEDAARKAGRTTEFTATESAMALKFLAQAGFNAQESIAALPKAINFATASETELAEATRMATKAMGAFSLRNQLIPGLTAAESKMHNLERVTNLMVKTSNSANTSLEEMFDALVRGAPAALAAGATIEDVAVLIAAMADVGIDSAQSGIGIRQLMLAIGAPGEKAARVMRRLGVDTFKMVNGLKELRRPLEVFNDFKEALKDMGSSDRINILKAMFGDRKVTKALAIINQSGAAVKKLQKNILDNEGTVDRIAKLNRNTVAGSYKALTSAIESVKIAIFEMEKGALKDLIDSMTKWVRLNEKVIAANSGEFFKTIRDNWPEIKEWAIWTGTVGVKIVALVAGIKILTGVMWALNIAMAANPWVLLVYGLIALTLAVTLFREEVEELWDELAKKNGIVAWIDDVILALEKIPALIEKIRTLPSTTVKVIGQAVGIVDPDLEPEQHIDATSGAAPVSAAEAAGAAISDQRKGASTTTTNKSEVTIRDETGRAEKTGGSFGPGLELIETGAF